LAFPCHIPSERLPIIAECPSSFMLINIHYTHAVTIYQAKKAKLRVCSLFHRKASSLSMISFEEYLQFLQTVFKHFIFREALQPETEVRLWSI
jgi:hypothetical protein